MVKVNCVLIFIDGYHCKPTLIDFKVLNFVIKYDIMYLSTVRSEVRNVELTNRWYSLKEICEYLGVSRDTVFKWIETKNMPAHKMGRQWKFKVEDVDTWIKSGCAAESNNE